MNNIKRLLLFCFAGVYAALVLHDVWRCAPWKVTYLDHLDLPPRPQIYIDPSKVRQTIEGEKVVLKVLSTDHLMQFYQNFSPKVRKMLSFPEEYSLEDTKLYIQYLVYRHKEGSSIAYSIFEKSTGRFFGTTIVRSIWTNDPGQMSIWTHEDAWGKGYAKEALDLITHEYFRLLPEATYFNGRAELFNTRSFLLMSKKCGFKHIGFVQGEDSHIKWYLLERYKNHQVSCR